MNTKRPTFISRTIPGNELRERDDSDTERYRVLDDDLRALKKKKKMKKSKEMKKCKSSDESETSACWKDSPRVGSRSNLLTRSPVRRTGVFTRFIKIAGLLYHSTIKQ